MGDIRFSVPSIQNLDPRIWEAAYITGIEGIPWLCLHRIDDQQFSIGREIDESGKLNIVWPTRSLGNLCLTTTSLRIGETPYALTPELARGTVYRLKSQTFEWQRIGLRVPDSFFPMAEESLQQLLHALTMEKDSPAAAENAQAAIDLALEAATQLCDAFSGQALEARRNNEGRLSTLLGIHLEADDLVGSPPSELGNAFNLVSIAADLGSIEAAGANGFSGIDETVDWATQNDQRVCLGPIIDFRDGHLPEWMFLLDEGFESVRDAACKHAQATVQRYQGKCHLWNCATGLNVPNQMRWSDEEILRMAVSIIETVRRTDDRNPVLLTINQPWSEYLRNDANGISPLHFADALIRADLGLSGLALELDFDHWPGGSLPRDPIEVSRLIDRWSMLGPAPDGLAGQPCWGRGNRQRQPACHELENKAGTRWSSLCGKRSCNCSYPNLQFTRSSGAL